MIDRDHLRSLDGDLRSRLAGGAGVATFDGEQVLAPVLPARAEGAGGADARSLEGCADLALTVLPRDDRGSGRGLESSDVHTILLCIHKFKHVSDGGKGLSVRRMSRIITGLHGLISVNQFQKHCVKAEIV